jgi:hypothetical protein
MYSNSRSVPQDNVKAHMRFNIAAANGETQGGENRDEIADETTPVDVSLAQAIARECMSSGYSDCGW